MRGQSPWIGRRFHTISRRIEETKPFSEVSDEGENEASVTPLDLILPDELLERILGFLPVASIFRASCVCKRWHEIVSSRKFLWTFSPDPRQKPWYFMFTGSIEPIGYAYDPVFRKWYAIDLPCIDKSNWFIASSRGLVCFMDNDSRSELYACNPITRRSKKLPEPPVIEYSDYSALAVSVGSVARRYTVTIVKSKQVPEDFFRWDISIYVYHSETMTWVTSVTEVLTGWRAGDASVICDGVLFILIYSIGGGPVENRHGLITLNLAERHPRSSVMRSFIPSPCPLTCGRLMNLKEKLVMVGGIGRQDRHDIIKGIGIWTLHGRDWKEIARMPPRYFQGFGEFDDVFASSGDQDLIYIQSYGAPALLVFDMNLKQWKWSLKGPIAKKFNLQLFSGFCFEPRLDIEP